MATPTPAAAQQEPADAPLELAVHPATGALTVEIGDLTQDGGLRRALASGLPLRLRLVAELWRDGFFDSQEGSAEWRGTVVHEPLEGRYRVEGRGADTVLVVAPTLEGAGRALRRSLRMPLRPRDEGRYYYLVTLEVETLSLSDLEELQRWLRGDLAPVVSGEREVESAVARGVRRLVVRVLGLPARRARVRTPTFRVGGDAGSAAPAEVLPADRLALDPLDIVPDAGARPPVASATSWARPTPDSGMPPHRPGARARHRSWIRLDRRPYGRRMIFTVSPPCIRSPHRSATGDSAAA